MLGGSNHKTNLQNLAFPRSLRVIFSISVIIVTIAITIAVVVTVTSLHQGETTFPIVDKVCGEGGC